MNHDVPVFTGQDAIPPLVNYCAPLRSHPFTLVCDANTYAALGQRVESALTGAGCTVTTIVLQGDEVIADERYLMRTLVQSPPGPQTFLVVGTGTLTDITRYVSFRTGNPFIAVPTAPSVDGFLSVGAPLVVGGIKETFKAQGPSAVFVDLPTSVRAPMPLKSAGFGDIMSKWTSLADWRLGYLLWEEPFDPAIEQRTRRTIDNCLSAIDEIAYSQNIPTIQNRGKKRPDPAGKMERLICRWKGKRHVLVLCVADRLNAD